MSLDPHLLRSRERALLMPVAQEMDVGADSLQRGSWGEITGLPRFPSLKGPFALNHLAVVSLGAFSLD